MGKSFQEVIREAFYAGYDACAEREQLPTYPADIEENFKQFLASKLPEET